MWQPAPRSQLAGSPSLKTVSLTFSIRVSGLKCRYEQFFLLQRSQTAGRGVGTNLPAFLFLPRQNGREGDVQNQTQTQALTESAPLQPSTSPPISLVSLVLAGLSGEQGPREVLHSQLSRVLPGAEPPSSPRLRPERLPGTPPPVLPQLGSGPPTARTRRKCAPTLVPHGTGWNTCDLKETGDTVGAVERESRHE